MSTIAFRPAESCDYLAVSVLLDGAFDGPHETQLIRQLREDRALALEMVAEENQHVVGYAGFPALLVPDGWAALSPVAVRGDRRGKGIANNLIRYGLDRLRQARFHAVLALGDPEFYHQFGFSARAGSQVRTPFPDQTVSLCQLHPGASRAPVFAVYPPAFDRA